MFLTSIHSKTEQDHIASFVTGSTFWIGMDDIDEEGRWEWHDGSMVDYTDWDSSIFHQEPNNWGGNEDCAIVTIGGRWNDSPC